MDFHDPGLVDSVLDDGDFLMELAQAARDDSDRGLLGRPKAQQKQQQLPLSNPGPSSSAAPALYLLPTRPIPTGLRPGTSSFYVEQLSGLKVSISNGGVGSVIVKERLSYHTFVKMSQLMSSDGSLAADWATVAVLASKVQSEGKNGNTYSRWQITDLAGTMITLFVFGAANQELYKESEGSVLMISGAKVSKDKERGSGGGGSGGNRAWGKRPGVTFSVDKAEQVQRIGHSPDFAFCSGTKHDGSQCRNMVNRSVCDYCPHHAAQALRKLQARPRPDMNPSQMFKAEFKAAAALAERKRPPPPRPGPVLKGPDLVARAVSIENAIRKNQLQPAPPPGQHPHLQQKQTDHCTPGSQQGGARGGAGARALQGGARMEAEAGALQGRGRGVTGEGVQQGGGHRGARDGYRVGEAPPAQQPPPSRGLAVMMAVAQQGVEEAEERARIGRKRKAGQQAGGTPAAPAQRPRLAPSPPGTVPPTRAPPGTVPPTRAPPGTVPPTLPKAGAAMGAVRGAAGAGRGAVSEAGAAAGASRGAGGVGGAARLSPAAPAEALMDLTDSGSEGEGGAGATRARPLSQAQARLLAALQAQRASACAPTPFAPSPAPRVSYPPIVPPTHAPTASTPLRPPPMTSAAFGPVLQPLPLQCAASSRSRTAPTHPASPSAAPTAAITPSVAGSQANPTPLVTPPSAPIAATAAAEPTPLALPTSVANVGPSVEPVAAPSHTCPSPPLPLPAQDPSVPAATQAVAQQGVEDVRDLIAPVQPCDGHCSVSQLPLTTQEPSASQQSYGKSCSASQVPLPVQRHSAPEQPCDDPDGMDWDDLVVVEEPAGSQPSGGACGDRVPHCGAEACSQGAGSWQATQPLRPSQLLQPSTAARSVQGAGSGQTTLPLRPSQAQNRGAAPALPPPRPTGHITGASHAPQLGSRPVPAPSRAAKSGLSDPHAKMLASLGIGRQHARPAMGQQQPNAGRGGMGGGGQGAGAGWGQVGRGAAVVPQGSRQGPKVAVGGGMSAMQRAFGGVISAGAAEPLESRYQAMSEDAEWEAMHARLEVMEKKDNLVQQLDSTMQLKVAAYQCQDCKLIMEFRPKKQSQNTMQAPVGRGAVPCSHERLAKVQAQKRWWQCLHCSRRFSTVGVLHPTRRCSKCNDPGQDFKAVSSYGGAKADRPAEQGTGLALPCNLLVRGKEQGSLK